MESPGFSDFRKWMDKWDTFKENEDKEDKLRSLINTNGLIMFFQKGDSMFGCPEMGRIAFARMKSEDDIDSNFIALNLSSDEPSRQIIQHKDLDEVKIMDIEDLIEKVSGK
jgi:hypothetical protein